MRQGQHKQRSRGRGRKVHNPANRSYDSNGPDVKIRGNAAHIAEKYSTLARDAQVSGDRIASENYLQHAEHYNRIVAASQAHTQQQQLQQQQAQQQQAQQTASASQPVVSEQESDTATEAEAVSPVTEKTAAQSDDANTSEEEVAKVKSNNPRQSRRRSPSGRNGSGSRSKTAAARSDEASAPKLDAESEAPAELDQTVTAAE